MADPGEFDLLLTAIPCGGGSRDLRGITAMPAMRRRNDDTWSFSESPGDQWPVHRRTVDVRAALQDAAIAAAEAAARAVAAAEVVDEALAILAEATAATGESRPRAAAPVIDTLSPREREVLVLVAEGRSNRAIAESLFVSTNTVKTHVASLLRKLRADTRVQLATMAARCDLASAST